MYTKMYSSPHIYYVTDPMHSPIKQVMLIQLCSIAYTLSRTEPIEGSHSMAGKHVSFLAHS